MAGNIKGITIEFDGNTPKLDKAIKDVEKSTRAIDQELKQVNNALKFNPTSIDLWRQKQDLLKQKISDTEAKLTSLKQKQQSMDAKGVDKNSAEYRKLKREIIETESKLKHFKGELKAVGNIRLRVASEQLKALGASATKAGNQLRGLSRAGALVAASLGAIAVKAATTADDLNTMSKIYGISTRDLQKYSVAADLVDVATEDIAKSHQKLTKSMYSATNGSKNQAEAFEKLGINVTNADGSLRDSEEVWQDTITALGNMENETERDALAMTLMGKSAANLNPLIEDGGETYKRVAETMEKYGLEFVDQETLDKANDFKDELDTIKMLGAIAFQTIGSQLAGVLVPAFKSVVDVAGKFANWVSGLNPVILAVVGGIAAIVAAIAPALLLFGALASAAGAVTGALAAISAPVLAVVAAIAALVGVFALAYAKSEAFREVINTFVAEVAAMIMPVVQELIAVLQELFAELAAIAVEIADDLAPVLKELMPVIMAVAKLLLSVFVANIKLTIRIIKTLATAVKSVVKTFSREFVKIVSTAKSVASKVKSIFSTIKNAIAHPIQTAVALVRAAWNKIKSILSAKINIPKIKLPHFKITGKLSLNPPQVPKLSVQWYKTGGIFNSPTLAGIGEAGPEAVIPLDTLWKKLDNIAEASAGNGVTLNVYAAPGMDINALTNAIEQRLVRLQKQRMKAWG